MTNLTLLLTLIPSLGADVQAPGTTPVERTQIRCQAALDRLVAGPLPGASAALILPDGELLQIVAGVVSEDTGERLEPEHLLLVGSTGKTFVTAAAHKLIAEGKLDLDAPAASYFDETPEWVEQLPNAAEVTILHLLRHQSGIPRYVFEEEFTRLMATQPERVWKPEELLTFLFDARPLFAPGEGWAYSDTNYIVLGLVIEELTGASFYDYVREHFVEPFDLKHTLSTDRMRLPRMAQGHVVMGRSMGVPSRTLVDGAFAYNVQFEWCGGGWASTPSDLALWARILCSGEAVEGPYLETLLDAVPARDLGPGARYGLGVILRDTVAGPAIGHDGFMPGYLTALAWFPDHGIAGAMQLNSDDGRTVGRPLAMVLAELVEIAAEELGR